MKPLYVAILVVIVAAASFWGGMQYAQSRRTTFRGNIVGQFQNGGQARNANQNGGQNRFGGRPVAGEITAADDKSITVKMSDGQSKIVLFSDTTQINQASSAAKSDLTVGKQVAVFGTENSDGSVTAQNIQLNPELGRFGNANATVTPAN